MTFDCAGQSYWCREADLAELAGKPPVRLLYRFDPLLLATKDKQWLIDEAHYKSVWRPSAHVAPVILVKGRIAGSWRYDRKASGLHVTLEPFARLSSTVIRAARIQAAGVAAFFGLSLAGLDTAGR